MSIAECAFCGNTVTGDFPEVAKKWWCSDECYKNWREQKEQETEQSELENYD